jgi:hypothetical protein
MGAARGLGATGSILKKPTQTDRARLAAFHDSGSLLTSLAMEVVQDVRWMDEANNLAVDVAARCAGLESVMRAVLRDKRAASVFVKNLQKCVG